MNWKIFKGLLLMFCILLLTTSCDNDKEHYEKLAYGELFDSLIMEDISLDSLSKSTNIKESTLIKMRYGIKVHSEELTSFMRELKLNFDKGNYSKCESLLQGENDFKIDENNYKISFSLDQYKKEEYLRNERFQNSLEKSVTRKINFRVNEFVDKKYSFINLPKSLFDYLTKSSNEIGLDYQKELNSSITQKDIEHMILYQINSYQDLLKKEHEVLFGKKSSVHKYTSLKLSDLNINITDNLHKSIVDRMALDFKDFSIDVFQDTVIALIVWFIISLIVESQINAAIRREISELKLSWGKNKGFWSNIASNALNILNSTVNIENAKKQIKRKWRIRQMWITILTTMILFIVSYFCITVPSLELEEKINTELQNQYIDYFHELDLWVVTIFNDITKAL